MKRWLAALVLAPLFALLAPPALADALIDNVDGMALDKDGKVIRFTGILISRDGKVTRLLGKNDARPTLLDWRTDEKGRVAIPGMIDAHGHVMSLGFQALRLDLTGTTSLQDALDRIKAYAEANPERKWIQGSGWNQEIWKLGRFPTAAELDVVVPDRPVWLERVDGHAGWANTAAIKAAHVTAATLAPGGGRIEKTRAGLPAGVFVDKATALIDKAVPPPTPHDREAAFFKAQEELLSLGITATSDMGTSVDDWLTFRRIGDAGFLRVRIMSYGLGVDTALAVAGTGPTPWLYGDKLRMGGIKLFADGALGSRGAWLKAPYSDAPGQSGLGFMTDTQLANLMSRGAMDNFQIAVHAIGDRANQQVLDAVDQLSDTYGGDRRWRIEHAQVVDVADLPRFARHGIIASMQPTHATSDMNMAEKRIGPDRLKGAYAWHTMLANQVPLAFGSDYPVESPNPFVGWAVAFSRTDANGDPAGGWRPEEAVTREQAWRAFTIGGAYAGFADDRFGRLAPGFDADFLIVDRNPLVATPTELRATKVLETWVGGEKVWMRK